MGKYLVTSSSNYHPFSYEELAAPVQQAAELHRQTQEYYDTLAMDTATLGSYITDNEGDRRAKQMYDNYNKVLSELQDDLWRYGYSPRTKRSLSAARQGYAGDIKRIAKAVETRQARSAEFHKYAHDHPDAIMGVDPGLSGLDNYLANDMYGSDYFAYSGTDFYKQVGETAKARVKELLHDPQVEQIIPGYYTRSTTEGATSDEVLEAKDAMSYILSGGDIDAYQFQSPVSKVLTEVLVSHLQATGAPEALRTGRLSEKEFLELVGWGGNALSQSIGETKTQDLNDKYYDMMLDLAKQQAKASASGTKSEKGEDLKIPDSNMQLVTGPGAHKLLNENGINKHALRTLFKGVEDSFAISASGQEVNGSPHASSLVYSEDLRREDYRKLGFDIGLDPMPRGVNTTSKDFLSGTVEHNGVRYETRYNPYDKYNGTKGVVEVREVGDKGSGTWMISPELTSIYHRDRAVYEDTLENYKKNDKEIYELAKVTPAEQKEFYDHWGVDFGTVPLTELRNYLTTMNPETAPHSPWDVVTLADSATDSKYIERLSDMMSDGFKINASGKVANKNRQARKNAKGSTEYVHELTDYGAPKKGAIRHPRDIFKFDDDNNATNIKNFSIDMNGILGNYVIIELTDSNKKYAVGIDMFESDALRSIFEEARYKIESEILSLPSNLYDATDKLELAHIVIEGVIKKIKDRVGYIQNGQVQGETKQENAN